MHEGIGLLGWTGPLEGPGGARREGMDHTRHRIRYCNATATLETHKNFLQCSRAKKMSGEPARIGESRLEDGMLQIPWTKQRLLERADVT